MNLTIQTLFIDPAIVKVIIDRVLQMRLDTIYWKQYGDFLETKPRVFKTYLGTVTGVVAGSILGKNGTHTCADRIVSIFQSHVRPIVRGKSKSPTEFGAKIGASIVNGYTFLDHHSWDAYNESSDLPLQVELYRQRFGFLPARIYADKIYTNKENRKLMKELEIQSMGRPLGRPPKESKTEEYKLKMAKAVGERNEIEATFGTGKRIYRANNIRAKLLETANCWTGMCYFVKNVMKFLRELLHALFFVLELMANPCNNRRIILPVQGLVS